MDVRLDGRVALVTGASKGIGRAVAGELAASGATVVLSSRKREALEHAASGIQNAGGDVDTVVANAGDPDQAAVAVSACVERHGRIDVLVNNAATNPYFGPAAGISISQNDKTWDVNFRGPLVFVQRAYDEWMREHGGVVVNIASVGGLTAEPGIGVYNATKAALIHLTQTLAAELGPMVRVNAVAPGLVKTDMARALWEGNEEDLSALFPSGRLGEPADIANAVTFLASDLASWITGTTLVVDGGALVRIR